MKIPSTPARAWSVSEAGSKFVWKFIRSHLIDVIVVVWLLLIFQWNLFAALREKIFPAEREVKLVR